MSVVIIIMPGRALFNDQFELHNNIGSSILIYTIE